MIATWDSLYYSFFFCKCSFFKRKKEGEGKTGLMRIKDLNEGKVEQGVKDELHPKSL